MNSVRCFLGLLLACNVAQAFVAKSSLGVTSQTIRHENAIASWAATHPTSLHSGVAYGLVPSVLENNSKNVLQREMLARQQYYNKDLKHEYNQFFDVDRAFTAVSIAYPSSSVGRQQGKQWLKAVSGSTAVVCAALLAHRMPALSAHLPYYYKTYPLQASIATCGFNSVFADTISQVQALRKKSLASKFEWKQTLSSIIYGTTFLGIGSNLVYTKLMPTLFPGSGVAAILSQACLDNFVFAPLLWLPPAYMIKAALVHQEPVLKSLQTYLKAVREENLLHRYWTMWLPAQMFTFSVVPKHLRVLSTAAFSFIWFLILTKITSQKTSPV